MCQCDRISNSADFLGGTLVLTQLSIAEAFLLHLALEGPDLLQPRLLLLHVLPQSLQLLLLHGLLLLPLVLLLQVAQALLLVGWRDFISSELTLSNNHSYISLVLQL